MPLGILLAMAAVAAGQTRPHASPRALFDQAMAAQQQGDLQRAVADYQEVLRLRPHLLAAHANLGVVLARMGNFSQAIAQYQAALAIAPGNQALQLDLALAWYKQKDWSRAAAAFSRLHQQRPASTRIAILLGDCLLHLGRPAGTIALLDSRPANAADMADLDWVLGRALIQAHHYYMGAARLEQAAAARNDAAAWALAARTRINLQDFTAARKDVDAARQLQPHLAELTLLDGMIRSYSGDDHGAQAAFEKTLAADPDNFDAHLYLGMVLYTGQKMAQAQQQFAWALRHRPNSLMARYQMARVQVATGHPHAALANLRKVEQQAPDWLQPHIELAALYFRLKQIQDGTRERAIVDRLSAHQQKPGGGL